MSVTRRAAVLLTATIVVSPALAAGEDGATGTRSGAGDTGAPSFRREVAPILLRSCVGCHGPETDRNRYRVDTFERLMTPGREERPPVVPGDPGASYLYRLITHERRSRRMPRKAGPLPRGEVDSIRAWIAAGAPYDGDDPSEPLARVVPRAHPPAPDPYPAPVPVTALAFAPGGKLLAASGYHEVTLWDPERGTLHRRCGDVAQRTLALDWHPGGELLLAAGGTPGRHGEAALIDLRDGRVVRRLAVENDVILDAAFGPAGEHLACASTTGAVRVFDVASGTETLRAEVHSDWVAALAWSPDGKRLATAGRDGKARAVVLEDGRIVGTYTGHEGRVRAVAWPPEGASVWSTAVDRAHRWDLEEGKRRSQVGAGSAIHELTAGADRIFLATSDGTVHACRARDGERLREYRGHQDWALSVAAAPQADRLAAGAFDGRIRVWSLSTGNEVSAFLAVPPPGTGAATEADRSPGTEAVPPAPGEVRRF